MDFDDDAPPDLVETGASFEEEEITVKVPITIVTGKPIGPNSLREVWNTRSYLRRLPRRRQDYTVELHFDSAAWQKSCCDYEW